MKRPTVRWVTIGLSIVVATLSSPEVVRACSVCYGDPNSPMTKGAMWGVIVLGIIVYGVLFSVAFIGATWIIRARKLQDQDSDDDQDSDNT